MSSNIGSVVWLAFAIICAAYSSSHKRLRCSDGPARASGRDALSPIWVAEVQLQVWWVPGSFYVAWMV